MELQARGSSAGGTPGSGYQWRPLAERIGQDCACAVSPARASSRAEALAVLILNLPELPCAHSSSPRQVANLSLAHAMIEVVGKRDRPRALPMWSLARSSREILGSDRGSAPSATCFRGTRGQRRLAVRPAYCSCIVGKSCCRKASRKRLTRTPAASNPRASISSNGSSPRPVDRPGCRQRRDCCMSTCSEAGERLRVPRRATGTAARGDVGRSRSYCGRRRREDRCGPIQGRWPALLLLSGYVGVIDILRSEPVRFGERVRSS